MEFIPCKLCKRETWHDGGYCGACVARETKQPFSISRVSVPRMGAILAESFAKQLSSHIGEAYCYGVDWAVPNVPALVGKKHQEMAAKAAPKYHVNSIDVFVPVATIKRVVSLIAELDGHHIPATSTLRGLVEVQHVLMDLVRKERGK